MNYSDSKELFLKSIREEFPTIKIELKEIQPTEFIPVFFITFSDAEELGALWDKANLYIAMNFQTILEFEFSTWNIYLFLLIPTAITNELKYKIENDTFSSRKIVIEGAMTHEEIISEHIVNDNLEIAEDKLSKDEFSKDRIISTHLEGRAVRGKKKLLADADEVVKEIKKALND